MPFPEKIERADRLELELIQMKLDDWQRQANEQRRRMIEILKQYGIAEGQAFMIQADGTIVLKPKTDGIPADPGLIPKA